MRLSLIDGLLGTLIFVLMMNTACAGDSLSSPAYGMEIREARIVMPDGVQLAADLFMPTGGRADERFPVVLEYTPYRKTESRAGKYSLYSYFVQRGYVLARVDIRGTGNSQGRVIPYEYSDIELDDGEAVIDWLSRQEWSTGKVGMFGISWGGFNSIQMAVRQPPALKAFIALMATEDLYQEDVHYIDGIIHTDSWMMSHDLYNAMPGAPDFILDENWQRDRFDVEPSVYAYMRQQRDGPFWDRASSTDKYDRITIPGLHIGGWFDGYRNSLPRMLQYANAPVKAIIGPWDHYYPHNAWPAPPMEWRHEAVRWFDQWLKGRDTGIMDEPQFAVYVREAFPPGPGVNTIPGYWRWEKGWPLERSQSQTLYAQADNGLENTPSDSARHQLLYKASVGLEGGGPVMWWGNIPPDQQPMDDHSLVYETEPLEAPLEILGFPQAQLTVSANATRANWAVRLSDVAPDGRVSQVSGAGFNGTHRDSAREPSDLVPGEEFPLDIELQFTSWVFPKGHRIRMAVSNGQWPMLWPTPYAMTSQLVLGGPEGARITLPVIPPGDSTGPEFHQPVENPSIDGYETLDAGNVSGYGEIESVQRDPSTGEAFGVATNSGGQRYPWGTATFEERIEHRTSDTNPAETSVKGTYALTHQLAERELRFEQDVEFSSDLENFRLVMTRRLLVDGELFREKQWDERIPRDFQ
jgi:putative CocE/NonD family hydrolase